MKCIFRNKSKKTIITLILCIISLTFFISIVYCAFESTMYINGNAFARIESNIRVSDFSLHELSDGVTSIYEEFSRNTLDSRVVLPNESSYVVYRLEISNYGSTDMGILNITGLDSNLKYEVIDYNLREKICDEFGKCNLGAKKVMYIKITYKNYIQNSYEYNISLYVDFRGFHDIDYGFIGNNNYPAEVIDGGTLSVSFSTKPLFSLYVDNNYISDKNYSYINGNFSYVNVTGDVLFSELNLYDTIRIGAKSDVNVDFNLIPSSDNGEGINYINSTVSDEFPIYYYRGLVTNNNLIFGNFCWKIVRTTNTGGIKLIYNGVPSSDGSCNNDGSNSRLPSNSKFNDSKGISSAGYMRGVHYNFHNISLASQDGIYLYGNDVTYNNGLYTLSDTYSSSSWDNDRGNLAKKYHYTCFNSTGICDIVYYIYWFGSATDPHFIIIDNGDNIEDVKRKSFSNDEDSVIKSYIDSWYANNLITYEPYIEDTVFCNDRTFVSGALVSKDTDAGSSVSYYSAYQRIVNSKPSLACRNHDSFTVSSENGNGALIYPIGLLSADEYFYAGATLDDNDDDNGSVPSYLWNSEGAWILSPYYFKDGGQTMFNLYSLEWGMSTIWGDIDSGVRPSISLVKGIKFSTGDGSVSTPYVIN